MKNFLQLKFKEIVFVLVSISILAICFLLSGCGNNSTINTSSKNDTGNNTISSTQQPSQVPHEFIEQFRIQCEEVNYKQLVRNPDKFKGQKVVYMGKVSEVIDPDNDLILRVNVTKNENEQWDDTIWVNYTKPAGSNRILEDDIVQLWGVIKGLRQYQAVLGNQISIPEIDARDIVIINENYSDPKSEQSGKYNKPDSPKAIQPVQSETTLPSTQQLDYRWFKDSRNGYLIWNPKPNPGETVKWEGESIQSPDNKNLYYVHGYGKATWYINGAMSQSDEGTHVMGKRHGKITQRFADGRVIVTEWNYGVKINQS